MQPFRYVRPENADDAARAIAEPGAVPLGGGTDLLVMLKEDLARPSMLVDLSRLPESRTIDWRPDGSVRVGGAVRVAELARDERVLASFPMLAQSCEAVGTPALRHMGTIAGNLCQRPRCWYFRQGISCHKSGGDTCPAVTGANQYHAILDAGPCWAPHTSDPAVALMTLGATIEIRASAASRTVPIASFFVPPRIDPRRETVLEHGEFVAAIEIPAASAGGAQYFEKLMQRGAWDFALVSIAAAKRTSGDVRMTLGGVAPTPWRVPESLEEDVASGQLSDDDLPTLADRALYDAAPLSENEYKVRLAKVLIQRGIRALG